MAGRSWVLHTRVNWVPLDPGEEGQPAGVRRPDRVDQGVSSNRLNGTGCGYGRVMKTIARLKRAGYSAGEIETVEIDNTMAFDDALALMVAYRARWTEEERLREVQLAEYRKVLEAPLKFSWE